MNERTQNNRQISRFLKIFIQSPKSQSFKAIRKTLSGSWIRSCKLNRLSTWQMSTQNASQIGAHFVIFLYRRREQFIKRL